MSQVQNPPGTGRRRNRGRRPGALGRRWDTNPQFLCLPTATETTINTYAETNVATPVVMMANGQMLVMEILKVIMYSKPPYYVAATVTLTDVHLAKKTKTAPIKWDDADCLFYYRQSEEANAAGTVIANGQNVVYDYTDGAGNGVLYAGKNIYLGVRSTSAGAGVFAAVNARILYRLKVVDAKEFVGIVTEQ